jgi:hypothetical protein
VAIGLAIDLAGFAAAFQLSAALVLVMIVLLVVERWLDRRGRHAANERRTALAGS